MPKEITMPKLSDTMEEGKVLRWLKSEGDPIERGEVIAEIETDKADMEMEAFDGGVLLAIRVHAGQTAAVGDVIGYVGAADEKAPGNGDGRGAAVAERTAKHETAARDEAPAESSGRDRAAKPSPTTAVQAQEEIPGPHADIADVIEPAGSEEEQEGEEGSTPQAPVTHGAESQPRGARSAAASSARSGDGGAPAAARPTKGLNDRLPDHEQRAEAFPRRKASPVARKLAAQAGVDLGGVAGSGPAGRIVKRDVERALASDGQARTSTRAAAEPAKAGGRVGPEGQPVPIARGELGVDLPHSRMRRAVAGRMAESKRTVPHFYTTVAVRMEEALKLKEALALRDPDAGVSVTHLIVKATALALERFPRVNGSYEEDRVRIPDAIHIGLAVAVEDGLIVPVIKDVGRKSVQEIAREARALVGKVRAGKLGQDDLSGATFSVSNMGMFPIEQFAAIIAPPQSAILAIGAAADEAVVEDGRVVPGKVMRMTLSADHRVVDGALAAAFTVEVRRFLENPLALVL